MSADNGYLLRKNTAGKLVIQMYFASADEYPSIDEPDALVFDDLDGALAWYESESEYSEYGLTTRVFETTEATSAKH